MATNSPKMNAGDYEAPHGDIIDYPKSGPGSVEAGYETTDVNAGGILVFIGGLFSFVIVFFFFCFFMGRVINEAIQKQDGPPDRWHKGQQMFAGAGNVKAGSTDVRGKREDLKSNAAIVQQELQTMTTSFPGPRLQTDDGNQDTADLHAREDLLLDHYSRTPGQPGVRIPIDRAMQLIAERGLPVAVSVQQGQMLAEDTRPVVTAPLTSGFARTGYELDTIEAREQKMAFGKATSEHAELKPVKRP